MSDAIAKIGPAVLPAGPLEFTPEQRKMILTSFLNGASEAEATVLLELARLRRLNPITKQIHFVKRWDSNRRQEVWSAQVGIDGFRAIAERTGKYDGQDEPEYLYEGKSLQCCKVKVYRKDWSRPVVGVAHFSEYAQHTKDGKLTHMWATKPHVMLSKCAEALAMRKAFPEDMSGLYAPEEMGAEEKELNQPPAQPVATGKRTAELKEKLAAKRVVVDVEPGETEAEAVARHTEAPQAEPDSPPDVVPEGTLMGKRFSELADRELDWFANNVVGRWPASVLDALDAELKRRGLDGL